MTDQYSYRRVFLAACMGMLIFGVVIIILGSILPSLVVKFQLDEIQAGTLTSILPAGLLVGSLLFGPLVDRYSYKYLLIVGGLVIMIGLEGIAFTENLHLLQFSLGVIGVGGGAINGGTNALVADISTRGRANRGANLSLLGVFYGIGALGMPFILGVLSKSFDHYQIIAATGFLIIVPLTHFILTKFPVPKQIHRVPLKKSLKLAQEPSLILLGMILFFQSGIEGIINNWSTLYLEKVSSFVEDQALYALSLFVLSLTLTRVMLTFLLNHVRSYIILIVSVIVVILGIICFSLPNFPYNEVIGLVLLGSGLAAGFPVILGYTGSLYPNLSGTAFSIVFVLAITGNILMNFLMGFISSSKGIGVYSILLMICTISIACLLVVTLKRISTKTTI